MHAIDSQIFTDSRNISSESESPSNEKVFSVENAFQDDIGFQNNPDYPLQSKAKGYRKIVPKKLTLIRLSKNCGSR